MTLKTGDVSRDGYVKCPSTVWERINVAMTVGELTITGWMDLCPGKRYRLYDRRRRGLLPEEDELEVLYRETGCTKEFIFNPEPIDLTK